MMIEPPRRCFLPIPGIGRIFSPSLRHPRISNFLCLFLSLLYNGIETSSQVLLCLPLLAVFFDLPNITKTATGNLVPLVHNLNVKATIGRLVVIVQRCSSLLIAHNPHVSSFPPDTHPATLLRLSASTPVLSDPKLSMCTIQPDAVDARELVCIFSERVAMAWSPSLSERCNQKGQEQACRGEGSDFGGGGEDCVERPGALCFVLV